MTFSAIIGAVEEWSLRIARTIVVMMFALIPVHFYVPCECCGIVAGVALVLLFIVGVLSILARRFGPFCWALVAMILHSMSMH
jgi:hypothetical protein